MKIHVIILAIFYLNIDFSSQEQEKDYYKILEIPRSSNEKQIKKAYRLMTKKYHPDHHDGDQSYAEKYT